MYKTKIIDLLKKNEELYFGDIVRMMETSSMHIGRCIVELIRENIIYKDSDQGKFKLSS